MLILLKQCGITAPSCLGKAEEKECPIAMAYGIFANEFWTDLPAKDRRLLACLGRTGEVYENFIRWHDEEVARPDSPERVFLGEFLAAA